MLMGAGIVAFGTGALLMALRESGIIDEAQFTTARNTLVERGALGLPPNAAS
jgi:hypothetical protein